MSEIILFDVDGVCAQFDQGIIKIIKPDWSIQEMEQRVKTLGDWDIFKLFSEEEMKQVHTVLKDPIFWEKLDPLPAAQWGYDKLKSQGFDIVFLTSSWDGCKEWCGTRKQWLKKHFDASPENVVISRRKDLHFGHMFIDDNPAHIRKWTERWKPFFGEEDRTPRSILCETWSNQGDSWFPRIITTEENKWKIVIKE